MSGYFRNKSLKIEKNILNNYILKYNSQFQTYLKRFMLPKSTSPFSYYGTILKKNYSKELEFEYETSILLSSLTFHYESPTIFLRMLSNNKISLV
jgi:hypothetical protein